MNCLPLSFCSTRSLLLWLKELSQEASECLTHMATTTTNAAMAATDSQCVVHLRCRCLPCHGSTHRGQLEKTCLQRMGVQEQLQWRYMTKWSRGRCRAIIPQAITTCSLMWVWESRCGYKLHPGHALPPWYDYYTSDMRTLTTHEGQ